MSLILPGAGQLYNGHFWRGIFWLIVTPGLWIGFGWIAELDMPRGLGARARQGRGEGFREHQHSPGLPVVESLW